MKSVLTFIALLASSLAFAEPLVLPVPGEAWDLHAEGPALTELKSQRSPAGYAYAGNAGRVNVSFFVEPPSCAAGESNEARFKCFSERAARSPILVPGTLKSSEVPNGVVATYMVRVNAGGRTVEAFNAHLLFSKAGKSGDFHASVVQPQGDDSQSVLKIVESVRFVDR